MMYVPYTQPPQVPTDYETPLQPGYGLGAESGGAIYNYPGDDPSAENLRKTEEFWKSIWGGFTKVAETAVKVGAKYFLDKPMDNTSYAAKMPEAAREVELLDWRMNTPYQRSSSGQKPVSIISAMPPSTGGFPPILIIAGVAVLLMWRGGKR
jgi:hypothetical protein